MSQYLSALTTIASEGLFKNIGIALDSATFGANYLGVGGWIQRYRSVPLIASYLGALDKHPTNAELKTFAKNKLPAIVDAIHSDYEPDDFSSYASTDAEIKINDLLGSNARFSYALVVHAKKIAGYRIDSTGNLWNANTANGLDVPDDSTEIECYSAADVATVDGTEDIQVGKFISHFQAALVYVQTMNTVIESADRNYNYLGTTFSNFDNLCTGNIAGLSTDLPGTGDEFINIGKGIDLKNVKNFGTPHSIARILVDNQLWATITTELEAQNLDVNSVKKQVLTSTLTMSTQKKCFEAFKAVSGSKLTTIKQKLDIENDNIATLADLLDLTKVFPLTFQNLYSFYKYGDVPVYTGTSVHHEHAGTGSAYYAIMPSSQADANAAFKKSLQQVKCVTEMTAATLGKLMKDLETDVSSDTSVLPEDTYNFFVTELGRGDGPLGTFYLTDIIGSPTHLPHHADRYSKIVGILEEGTGLDDIANVFSQLDNASLTSGQISTLLTQADGYIDAYIADYPTKADILNEGYQTMALHVADEIINMYDADINYDTTLAGTKSVVGAFAQMLHSYATQTELYGPANVISQLANENTQSGRAIHAALKEGYNKAIIESYGLRPYMIPPDTQPLNPPKNSVDYSDE